MNLSLDGWLPGGAILDKELRVASRRLRYYAIRVGYVCVMIMIFCFAVLNVYGLRQMGNVQVASRMAFIARGVVWGICWLQFLVAPTLMVIMMSGAISDEVSRRTLGVLMTTPLSCTKIALGKLLSRFVQALILLGLSLPVLAMVRVMGGIPWDFVISAWCVTLSLTFALGNAALMFSTMSKRMSQAMGRTLFVFILYSLIEPFVQNLSLWQPNWGWNALPNMLHYGNSLHVMMDLSSEALSPGAIPSQIWWPGHCLIIMGGGLVFLLITVWRIRLAGMRQLIGQGTKKTSKAIAKNGPISRVWDRVVVWHCVRQGWAQLERLRTHIEIGFVSLVLLVVYVVSVFFDIWSQPIFHSICVGGYLFAGLLRLGVYAGGTITEEKEQRSLILLLTTDLNARSIVKQKIFGVFLRVTPIWAMLLLHLLLFTLLGKIHPLGCLLVIPVFLGGAFFVASFGVCISTWCRRTSMSVSIVVGVLIVLNFPILCPYLGGASPPILSGLLIYTTSGDDSRFFTDDLIFPLIFFVVGIGIYALLGTVFALLAPHWIRHGEFSPLREEQL